MMNGKWMKTGVVLAVLVALVGLPFFHLVLVVMNLVVSVMVLGLQVVLVRLPRKRLHRRPLGGQRPFVSIHVPAHNEPPELLKETLRSLNELDWDNYEVLVIDNNTTDKKLWQPVAGYCEELGPKFRFFHVEQLTGFKAGALNYIHPYIDDRTEFIFIVDADYVVEPDAIRRGLSYFTSQEVGLVQFPQDYRNAGPGNLGITLDFKHFFSAYMNMANRLNCAPSTGTLSFVRNEALCAVKGFGTEVITEDADLGLQLSLQGYRSVYVHEPIGDGVMPHDLPSLKQQRWRWAFGNAQILKLNARTLLTTARLTPLQKIGFFAHLTAWFNFNLLPTCSLILLVPLFLTGGMAAEHPYIATLSGVTLVFWLVLRLAVFYYGLSRDGHSWKEIGQGFAAHAGLGWAYSSNWLDCLLDHRSVFIRTNKFLTRKVPDAFRTMWAGILPGVALGISFVALLLQGYVIAPLAALLIAVTRFMIFWVSRQLRRTLELTRVLEADEGKAQRVEDEGMLAWELKETS